MTDDKKPPTSTRNVDRAPARPEFFWGRPPRAHQDHLFPKGQASSLCSPGWHRFMVSGVDSQPFEGRGVGVDDCSLCRRLARRALEAFDACADAATPTADDKKPKRLRIDRETVRLLQDAFRAARLDNCGVGAEHQDAMHLYLHSWVASPIQRALERIGADVPKEVETYTQRTARNRASKAKVLRWANPTGTHRAHLFPDASPTSLCGAWTRTQHGFDGGLFDPKGSVADDDCNACRVAALSRSK